MSKTNSIFDYRLYYKRYLPHIQPRDAILFITYCERFENLKNLFQKLEQKKISFFKSIENLKTRKSRIRIRNFNKKQFYYVDNYLASTKYSHQWLSIPEIANIIMESLIYNDGKMYDLLCYCIMPNHVHLLIKPLLNQNNIPYSITKIMKTHKSFTAKESNKLINRKGRFWHYGFYDHYIRNERELYNVIRYILDNPVRAGLVKNYEDWEFSWVFEEIISI
jgi:REP element-mobilizing transposase RayT